MVILGIKLENRIENSSGFQNILTKFGCDIKTRLGLHEVQENSCTRYGVILLELTKNSPELENELKKIENIEIKKMEF